jgi:hypothetical protein
MNTQSNAQPVVETSTAKRGRGRPAGSNSFANVQIKQLLTLLSEDAIVPVSRIWMRDTFGAIAEPAPVIINTANNTVVENQTEEKIQFHIEKFEDANCPF